MKEKLTILTADDDSRHRAMLKTLLTDWGYKALEAGDGQSAVEICAGPHKPDLALLDWRMPQKNGFEALLEIKAANPSIPVIIMTAYSDVPAAVEAIRNGAYDYLTKPLDFPKLKIALRNALNQLGLARENEALSASLAEKERGLLGRSQAMRDLEAMIKAVGPSEAIALITGESGTGKELAARALHAASRRAKGPFVAVNCGALTESLLASELFGHEKGAFTGADKKHEGLFIQATGGSLFLDEIGEMPLNMQVKLLRVLQEREITPVGGGKPQPVDCRIIAATNRNLSLDAEVGKFRQDLYYRINVVNLKMPALRERKDDIPLLAHNFASRFARENNKKFTGISQTAMNALLNHDWPGNVRELENVMERAIILMPGEHVGERDLPERIQKASPEPEEKMARPENVSRNEEEEAGSGETTLEEIERAAIMRALANSGGNKTEAARALGIARKTLHAKLNKYQSQGQPDDSAE